MEINTSNCIDSCTFGAKSPQIDQTNQPINIPVAMTNDNDKPIDMAPKKRKKVEREDSDKENSEEEAEEDKILALADSLNELCGNPALLMGIFDYFFENVPKDVKIQYKNAGISINTYYLAKPKKTHINLLKYLSQKFKST